MSVDSYEELKHHIGHDIEVVQYGNGVNVAIECITCGEVLLDYEKPDDTSCEESTLPSNSSFIICWAGDNGSDWEVIDGEDTMQQRVDELYKSGATTIFVFPESAEIDKAHY